MQFIQMNNEENTELETIVCGVPQGLIHLFIFGKKRTHSSELA